MERRWPSSPKTPPINAFQVILLSNYILCVGYCGYIPGVKSENVFGESYGKTSGYSGRGEIPRGFDYGDGDAKYKTVA